MYSWSKLMRFLSVTSGSTESLTGWHLTLDGRLTAGETSGGFGCVRVNGSSTERSLKARMTNTKVKYKWSSVSCIVTNICNNWLEQITPSHSNVIKGHKQFKQQLTSWWSPKSIWPSPYTGPQCLGFPSGYVL